MIRVRKLLDDPYPLFTVATHVVGMSRIRAYGGGGVDHAVCVVLSRSPPSLAASLRSLASTSVAGSCSLLLGSGEVLCLQVRFQYAPDFTRSSPTGSWWNQAEKAGGEKNEEGFWQPVRSTELVRISGGQRTREEMTRAPDRDPDSWPEREEKGH